MELIRNLKHLLQNRRPALFLDYDGTLTPIVEHPDQAVLKPNTQKLIQKLANKMPVAVLSGRDLNDLKKKIGLSNIAYAGSHGFEIELADGQKFDVAEAKNSLSSLDRAEELLRTECQMWPGLWVDRKKYALAVHYRQFPNLQQLENLKKFIQSEFCQTQLTFSEGKKIFELKPNLNWHKGRALSWLIKVLGIADESVPIYLGDDTTDEDAFLEIRDKGISILVAPQEKASHAKYRLNDTAAVQNSLEQLLFETST